MGREPLPQISQFNLRRSLQAAEIIATQADRTSDSRLRRALLTASCDVLDFALDRGHTVKRIPPPR